MGIRWDPDGCRGVWGVNKGGAVAQMYVFGGVGKSKGCAGVRGICSWLEDAWAE